MSRENDKEGSLRAPCAVLAAGTRPTGSTCDHRGVVSVRVLGPVTAEVEGRPVAIGSPKQRLLLAVLAATRGVVTRDKLIDALWDDAPPPSAEPSLMGYVSRLRKALGSAAIEGHPRGYRLRVDHLDALEFEQLVDVADSAASVEDALGKWRADAFGELSAHPSLLGEARRLDELRIDARLRLASLLLDAGEAGRTTSMLEAIVAEEPLREDAWELLARALLAGNRAAEAVRAAQRCRTALGEVGLEPSPRLLAVEDDALRHRTESAEESVLPDGSEASRGPIRYAGALGRNLAYQVVGGGAADLVISSYGSVSIDSIWDEPRFAGFVTRLSRSNRVILYDTRGVGLSDPVEIGSPPSLEDQADDIVAVLDAARSVRAVLVGVGDGGPVIITAAHRHPSRVSALVLINTFARLAYAADYPTGIDPERLAAAISSSTDPASERDTSLVLRNHAPSVASDPAFRRWWERAGRRGASPATANALWRVRYGADVRLLLPSIRMPSVVLHRRNNRLIPFAHGAYLANHIATAKLIELEGSDQPPFTETPDRIVDEVNEFLAWGR